MTEIESKILTLLESILESDTTPDDACRECPELLPIVRARLDRFRSVQAEIAAVFPPREPSDSSTRPFIERSPNSLPNLPGYLVENMVGSGGMGVVYRARHLKLNRVVALKMLLAGGYAGPRELERFKREAEAVAALEHPNIVQVHDAGEHDGIPYFTMELVEGASLADALRGVPQPPLKAAQSLAVLARAVNAAHHRGIVHRDLKPANILVARDGALKITDFGLARHYDSNPGQTVTLTGERVGTPSYMAPEQALGRAGALGPAGDIYSLGAILYEMLTGRPPFRAASPVETQRQVIEQEPAPPSRLNAGVPRDIETICLKCLQKDPRQRYASASALADDLQNFIEGRPIVARPVGWVERSWRWSRRNPTAAMLLATALALVGLASGGGMWLVHQRDAEHAEADRQAVEALAVVGAAVQQAERLSKVFQFDEARAALDRASGPLEQGWRSLGDVARNELRRQMDRAKRDLKLVEQLDVVRTRQAAMLAANDNRSGFEPFYSSVFDEAQLGKIGDNTAEVAERVRARTVRAEIVAGLDDWASITSLPQHRAWLLEVARRADPDALRDRFRQPDLWEDRTRLTQLLRDPEASRLSPQLVTALSRRAQAHHLDAVSLLSGVVAQYPRDFWLNFQLGAALFNTQRYDDSLGYYRVALALRPDVTMARVGVGMVLHRLKRYDEAIEELRRAIDRDPAFTLAYTWLTFAFNDQGRLDQAIEQMQQIVALHPKSADVKANIGNALYDVSHWDKAVPYLEQAIELDPKQAIAHSILGLILRARGRSDEAVNHFQRCVEAEPDDPVWHMNFGLALADKGRLDESIAESERALELDPTLAGVHVNLAVALGGRGRVDDAIGHARRAIELEPEGALPHHTLSALLRDKGLLEEAIHESRRALELDSNLEVAQVLLYRAVTDAARATLRDPSGPGKQPSPQNDLERSGARLKALEWMRACVEVTARVLSEGKTARWSLTTWQTDPALAGVRDPSALASMPEAERQQWGRLWADLALVQAVELLTQGRERAAQRDWAGAAYLYTQIATGRPMQDGHFWFEYAAVSLLSGNRSAYASTCTRMIEARSGPNGPRAYHVARACTLAPVGAADMAALARLANAELCRSADQFWSLTEQGALAYRAGRFEESASLFEQSLQADPTPGRAVVNWLWLAMADQKLGRTDEARRWLKKGETWLDEFAEGMPPRAEAELGLHLHNWLEALILCREAEAATNPRAISGSP